MKKTTSRQKTPEDEGKKTARGKRRGVDGEGKQRGPIGKGPGGDGDEQIN